MQRCFVCSSRSAIPMACQRPTGPRVGGRSGLGRVGEVAGLSAVWTLCYRDVNTAVSRQGEGGSAEGTPAGIVAAVVGSGDRAASARSRRGCVAGSPRQRALGCFPAGCARWTRLSMMPV